MHDAPGEAEAECALLQQQGVVDAVLSEDVDTIMFGCTLTLRNWSAEGTRAAKTPTHVSVYDVAELKQGETGLDREGMVLVAMMAGGDYIPEGVPGCGVKVACEAARAGFGTRLCRIKRSDPDALARWREELMEELRTNKSKAFRTKHMALTIPDEFPSVEVLRYYTHPVVSQAAIVDKLRREIPTRKEIDIAGLRAFTAETFDWVYKIGAVKFIRVLAPSLLVQALLNLSHEELDSDDPDVRQEVEGKLVRSITIRRTHFSTDATPELRISYMPNDIVGVDLDAEEDEVASTFGRSGLALNSDDEVEEQIDDAESGPKKVFDPLQPDLAWVPETVAKLGVPLSVEDWEGKQRKKQRAKARQTQAKSSQKKVSDMPTGALNRYVKPTKPVASTSSQGLGRPGLLLASSQLSPSIPPLSQQVRSKSSTEASRETGARPSSSTAPKRYNSANTKLKAKTKAPPPRPSSDVNPWTLASSQLTPKASRFVTTKEFTAAPEAIYISSSPTGPTSPRDSGPLDESQPSALLVVDDHFPKPPSPLHDRCSPSPSPPARTSAPGVTLSPRKHTRSSEEPCRRPAAKRPQRCPGAAALRSGSLTGGPARPRRAPDTTAQASIKTFGRLSKAVGKGSMVPETKAAASLSDSDDELEELHNLGSKITTSRGARDMPVTSRRSKPGTLDHEDGGASFLSRQDAEAVVEIPSSPPPWSPPGAVSTKSETTRLYIPRTSDTGHGYFREVEVSREAADRMMSKEHDKRPGSKRIWRESEVSILDLTGED